MTDEPLTISFWCYDMAFCTCQNKTVIRQTSVDERRFVGTQLCADKCSYAHLEDIVAHHQVERKSYSKEELTGISGGAIVELLPREFPVLEWLL